MCGFCLQSTQHTTILYKESWKKRVITIILHSVII
nr:MAG TPA: hypothetical protein [Caudoviricetes sp.]